MSEDYRWMIGYLGDENCLEHAYVYETREDAEEEFNFDHKKMSLLGTVFLAKIIKKQVRKKIIDYSVETTDLKTGKTQSQHECVIEDKGDS